MKKVVSFFVLIAMSASLVFAVSANSSLIVDSINRKDIYSFTHLIKQDPEGSLTIERYGSEYNIYRYVIDNGTVDMIKVLMESNVDYNAKFKYWSQDYTPLEYALEKGKSSIATQLLTAKDIVSDSENNVLMKMAVYSGTVGSLSALKTAGVSVNSKFNVSGTYYTALSYAYYYEKTEIVNWLLSQDDIDVDCIGSSKPILYYAIIEDDEAMVKKLMEMGANPGRTFDYSSSIFNCLGYAIYSKKSFNLISAMIVDGDNATLAAEDCEKSPLCYAVENNDLTVVEALVKAGANPNTTFSYSSSITHNALSYAIKLKCRETVIEALLKSPIFDTNCKGCTYSPYYYAIDNKNPAVLKLLADYSCNANKSFTYSGVKYTALSYAIRNSVDDATLDILLSVPKIDVNGRGSDYPPIYYALYNRNYYALEKLIEHGCNVNKTFKSYNKVYTPLGYTSDSKMKEMLTKAGASSVPLTTKSEFQLAIDSNNIDTLNAAISAADDLNEIFEVDSKEYSLLSYACYVNADIELINVILSQSEIDINGEDCPVSPIGYAVVNGNSAILQALLDAGVNPNLKFTYQGEEEIPLQYAVEKKDKAMIEVLLAHEDIDLYEETISYNAMETLIRQENTEYLNMFISAGFDVNKRISSSETILTLAIQYCSNDFIKYILELENIDVNSSNASTHPVILAIRKENLGILRLLIQKGANPNAQTKYWSSTVNAIGYAIFYESRMSIINTLIKAEGSDVNASNLDYPCIIAALNKGDLEALTSLIENGADPNVTTTYWSETISALEYSIIQKGRVSLTSAIINAPTFNKDDNLAIARAYLYAIKNNDTEIVELLVNSNLKTTSKILVSSKEYTPLEYAIYREANSDIIRILQNQD